MFLTDQNNAIPNDPGLLLHVAISALIPLKIQNNDGHYKKNQSNYLA